jgi:flagellar hook-associated protein 2
MINQLMQIEAQPQTSLKNKVTRAQTAVASYQSVNSAVAALKSAGDALGQLSTWRAIKATSSSSAVTATTSSNINAATGSLTFDVTSLASKQYTTMAVDTTPIARFVGQSVDSTAQLAVPDEITITTGSGSTATTTKIDVSADKSAAGIVNAINNANCGVTAYVRNTGDNQGILEMTSAKTGASGGFQITGLDKAGVVNGKSVNSTTQLAVPDQITITTGSGSTATTKKIDVSADKSAAGIVNAINNANCGVAAYVLKTADNQGVLQMTSAKTGVAGGFQITGLDNAGIGTDTSPTTSPATTPAKDAQLQVNGGAGTFYQVNSSTNTFANLMPGVTLTVSKQETNVTVDVANDANSIADKFQAMVDAANAALQEVSKQTAYDPSTKTGSPLTGDFSVREMQQKILSSISMGLSWDDPASTKDTPLPKIKFGSLSKLGIQLDSTGQLTFDRTKFNNAYASDPVSIQTAGTQFGDQVEATGAAMSTGLKSIITGRNNAISDLNDQISNWDVRLVAKREALQKQYSGLEVALGKLKDQSNWLSGQLASLS